MDGIDDIIRKHVGETVDTESVPSSALQKAKDLMKGGASCPHCGKAITPFKRPLPEQRAWNALWLGLTVAGFLLSFVFPHYFIQFTAVALLSGIKWALEQRSTKTQILIYKALKEEVEGPRLRDLHKASSRL